MAKVSGREEQEELLWEIQNRGLSPVIALLSSIRRELSETRTKCPETDSRYDPEAFELCLSVTYLKLAEAIEKLKMLQEKISEEII